MRKTEKRIHRKLSNGQHLALYFNKRKVYDPDTYEKSYATEIGLRIDKKKRFCNDWYQGKKRLHKKGHKQTGKCGLEGLIIAYREIKKYIEQMNKGEFIIVGWADKKRENAYRYLMRLGFEEGVFLDRNIYYYQK